MKIDFKLPLPAVIVGLMSGTSADGIDAAVLEIRDEGERTYWRLLGHTSTPWPAKIRAAILDACRPDAPLRQLTALDFLLGEEFALAAIGAARAAGVPLAEVAAIASHGQTVWHQPEPLRIGGREARGTRQIGEPAVIAARTGCVVVADFRCADMAAGGQGAPLVPFADHILFAHDRETRAVQNLGGIANVTLLPSGAGLDQIVAFDTGPGNMVMDGLVARATNGAVRCDLDGALAAAGRVDRALLSDLMANPFFAKPPPKSTGREEFGEAFCDSLSASSQLRRLSVQDLLATALALTVESIGNAYREFLIPRSRIDVVILGGGGTRNPALVSALRSRLAPARIALHAEYGMPDEAKESAAFAILGYCTLRGRPSNAPSATGARRQAILGKIALPPPG